MRNILRILIGIGFSCAILALLLNQFSSGLTLENRPSILLVLKSTLLPFLACYFVLHIFQLTLRALRYRLLLVASGERSVPSFPQMFLVTGIRNMCADLLPSRLGEISYIALLNRGYQVSAKACLSSLGLAITFDFVALFFVVLCIFAVQIVSFDIELWMLFALGVTLCIAIAAIIGAFYFLPVILHWHEKFEQRSLFKNKIFKSLKTLLAGIRDSVDLVKKSGKLIHIFGLSLAIRFLKYGGFYLLFCAVAYPSFKELSELPIYQVVSALIGGELMTSLPIPSFMGFGLYEAGSAGVLVGLGLDKASAFITMFAVHIWSQIFDYVIGGVCLFVFILLYKELKSSGERGIKKEMDIEETQYTQEKEVIGVSMAKPSYFSIFIALIIFFSGGALLANELRQNMKHGAVSAPPQGVDNSHEFSSEFKKSQQTLRGIKGFAVWSSNRFGNHDIVRMDLATMQLSQLTTHKHAEFYPRISPDGKKLVFARSRAEWVSQRNWVAWDVYVLDLLNKEETLLAENASFPSWVDNDRVSYLQDGVKVVVKKLSWLGKETVVFESAKGNTLPQGALLSTPVYNASSGTTLFTAKQSDFGMKTGYWGTALSLPDKSIRGLYNGCQAFFSSNGEFIYQVSSGGKHDSKGNRFLKVDSKSLISEELLDFDHRYSHIYFPKQSYEGSYLIFAGSEKGHEHDTADYEIFLWNMRKPKTSISRLSFHTGNDNWPDIYIHSQ